MKKKLTLIIVFLTVLINVVSFVHINKNLINNVLFDKTVVTFQYNDNINLDQKFINMINTFSKKENIEISQYSFLSNNKIDIYSTDDDKYKEILLIPNLLYNKDIKVHRFGDVYNIGLKNLFYLDSKDVDVISKFSKEFNEYGEVYADSESVYEGSNFSLYNIIRYLDADFLSIFNLLIFIYSIVLISYYLNQQKEYLIYDLWGYSYIEIYCKSNKFIFSILLTTIIIINTLMIGIIYILNLEHLSYAFLYITNIVNLIIIILLFVISIILFKLIYINSNRANTKHTIAKTKLITAIFKVCLLLLVVFSSNNLLDQAVNLNKSKENLSKWKSIENLYHIYRSYSPNQDDLNSEYEMNETIVNIYKELSDLSKVFMIDTVNFSRPTAFNIGENDIDYNYKYNVKDNEDLYSPHGRNIKVDINYLKKHEIKTFDDNENVLNSLNYSDNVLNVLVPQELKQYEDTILKSYREWFYFSKVEVPNIYKEARNEQLSSTSINDLNVNIIYVENNLSYFTYNASSGNFNNEINDPLVTVYTGNIDNSFLASGLGGSIVFESENEYSALNELKNITQKYNVTDLNNISSVYGQKGDEINFIEDKIDRLILNTLVTCLMLICLMVLITYIYYKSHISQIIIKSLYGYKFIDTYRDLLLSNLYVYVLAYLVTIIIDKEIFLTLTLVTILMLIVDFIAINIVNKSLISKGEIKIVKGGTI